MFLLFGWGKRTIKEYGPQEVIKCQKCSNAKAWEYKRVTTWFTLFFIPLIPYQRHYIRMCPICGSYEHLTKDEFIALVEGGVVVDISRPADPYAGKTKTQANYLREMAALKAERAQAEKAEAKGAN